MNAPLIITTKSGPDLDGVASAVAYAEFLTLTGTPAAAVLAGRPDAEARYVLQRAGVQILTVPPAEHYGVVLVDMSTLHGLPAFVDSAAVVEVIDHRLYRDASTEFPNAHIQLEAVGAAATLIFERFIGGGVNPSNASAILLQAGIHSNTQCLKGSITTLRDVEAANHLQELHPLPEGLLSGQFQARRQEILADLNAALMRESKTFDHADGSFIISQLECPGALDMAADCTALMELLGRRTMVNLVDPTVPASILMVTDPELQAWVCKAIRLPFEGLIARPGEPLLRKQIVHRLMMGAR
jgi:nanoRNase/pAp phosphatase (c-di-AMP/oligoRNAs hydrolase)